MRRFDSALTVIFRWPIFDARLQNHCGRSAEIVAHVAQRHAELFLESHFAFEDWRWTGHAMSSKQRGENAVAGGGGKSDAFPMRELACAGLPHGRAGHTGNVHRMSRVCRI